MVVALTSDLCSSDTKIFYRLLELRL